MMREACIKHWFSTPTYQLAFVQSSAKLAATRKVTHVLSGTQWLHWPLMRHLPAMTHTCAPDTQLGLPML